MICTSNVCDLCGWYQLSVSKPLRLDFSDEMETLKVELKKAGKLDDAPKVGTCWNVELWKPNGPKDFWAKLNFFKICHCANRYSLIFGYCDTEVIEDDSGGVLESIHWRNMKKIMNIIFSRPCRGSHRRIQLRSWTHGGKLSIQRLGSGKFLGVELTYCLGYLGHWWTRRLYT